MKTHHPKEQRLIHDNGVKLNPSSRKNLDVRPYDRATFNMRVQLYRGHTSATALSSSPVVSALGS